MSIPDLVRDCLNAFKQLLESDGGGASDRLQDELGRFRIWASNISAHSTGQRSLEYRLRDSSELKEAVVRFLSELLQLLRNQLSNAADPQEALGDFEAGDWELFGLEAQSPLRDDESSGDFLEDVSEITDCLLRISMSLRNPARHDQIRYAETDVTRYFEPYDWEHVRTKFPEAPEVLVSRLSKVISHHRGYIKYRDEHHLKLAQGIDCDIQEGPLVAGGLASTKATSVCNPHQAQDLPETVDSDAESAFTATSYAASINGDAQLRPPPLPVAGIDGAPFECPICCGIITASNTRAWIQHIYEDIPPYVCVSQECEVLPRPFPRRRDWQKHMRDFHEQQWVCLFGCEVAYNAPNALLGHLRALHGQEASPDKMASLVTSCARDKAHTQPLVCPLCGKSKRSMNLWYKHVGRHLEQLSLFALPKHMNSGSDVDEQDDSDVELPASEDHDSESEASGGRDLKANHEEELRQQWEERLSKDRQVELEVEKMVSRHRARAQQPSAEPASRISTGPVYTKVRRDDFERETLQYFELPWEYDRADQDYIIIKGLLTMRMADALFQHTAKLRAGMLEESAKKGKGKASTPRGRSRSGTPSDGGSRIVIDHGSSERDRRGNPIQIMVDGRPVTTPDGKTPKEVLMTRDRWGTPMKVPMVDGRPIPTFDRETEVVMARNQWGNPVKIIRDRLPVTTPDRETPKGDIQTSEMSIRRPNAGPLEHYKAQHQALEDQTGRSARPRPRVSAILAQLEALHYKYRCFLPQCHAFLSSPPACIFQREDQRRHLSNCIIRQILLELDDVQVEGDLGARVRRKEIVDEVRYMLNALDVAWRPRAVRVLR